MGIIINVTLLCGIFTGVCALEFCSSTGSSTLIEKADVDSTRSSWLSFNGSNSALRKYGLHVGKYNCSCTLIYPSATQFTLTSKQSLKMCSKGITVSQFDGMWSKEFDCLDNTGITTLGGPEMTLTLQVDVRDNMLISNDVYILNVYSDNVSTYVKAECGPPVMWSSTSTTSTSSSTSSSSSTSTMSSTSSSSSTSTMSSTKTSTMEPSTLTFSTLIPVAQGNGQEVALGITLGAVVVIIVFIVILLVLLYRRRRHPKTEEQESTKYKRPLPKLPKSFRNIMKSHSKLQRESTVYDRINEAKQKVTLEKHNTTMDEFVMVEVNNINIQSISYRMSKNNLVNKISSDYIHPISDNQNDDYELPIKTNNSVTNGDFRQSVITEEGNGKQSAIYAHKCIDTEDYMDMTQHIHQKQPYSETYIDKDINLHFTSPTEYYNDTQNNLTDMVNHKTVTEHAMYVNTASTLREH